MTLAPTLTKEQLEAEAYDAWQRFGSLRKAARVIYAHPDTIRERARRHASRHALPFPPFKPAKSGQTVGIFASA